jgi:hypothetical protein
MGQKQASVRVRLSCKCGAEADFAAAGEARLAAMIAAAKWSLDEGRYVGGARLAGTCPQCASSMPSTAARHQT